jgi:hypothetical protein
MDNHATWSDYFGRILLDYISILLQTSLLQNCIHMSVAASRIGVGGENSAV